MRSRLPGLVADLAQSPHIATVGTIQRDGSPQLSPVWIANDGVAVAFSTVVGRQKYSNITRDSRISISITDAQNPMRRAEVRGRAEILDDPESSLIDDLSLAYTGHHWTESDPCARRVIIRLIPSHVVLRS